MTLPGSICSLLLRIRGLRLALLVRPAFAPLELLFYGLLWPAGAALCLGFLVCICISIVGVIFYRSMSCGVPWSVVASFALLLAVLGE